MAYTNLETLNIARAQSPTFANLVSEETAKEIAAHGQEALASLPSNVLNEWYQAYMTWLLLRFDIADSRNPLENSGLVETYDQPYGMYAERIAVLPQKGINPGYLGIKNGDSVDPNIVRLPEIKQYFLPLQMNYQNMTTVDSYRKKTILSGEYGMDMLASAQMEQMTVDYRKFRYETALKALNAGINSTTFPLQASQTQTLASWTEGAPTAQDLQGLIQAIKDVAGILEYTPSTSAFNAAGFDTAVDADRFIILIRNQVQTRIQGALTTGPLFGVDPSYLDLPYKVQQVSDFGNMEAYKEAGYTTKLYPVYDSLGAVSGFAETENASEVTVNTKDVYWKDGNDDIIAIIAQKGLLVETVQNPVTIDPMYPNPRGLYQDFFFNAPNNGMNYFAPYNMVLFKKPSSV